MGNQGSNDYDREEKIRNEQIKIENLSRDREKMWEDPFFSFEECVHAGIAEDIMRNNVESLKQMNEAEKNFKKILI